MYAHTHKKKIRGHSEPKFIFQGHHMCHTSHLALQNVCILHMTTFINIHKKRLTVNMGHKAFSNSNWHSHKFT